MGWTYLWEQVAAGFDFSPGVGSMYTWSSEGATGSGLFWGWAMALGFNFMGDWVEG